MIGAWDKPMVDASPLRATELPGRGFLRLAGEETVGFLQGLVSNDVTKLEPGRAVYAALLTPQGKYLFDFLLYRLGDAVLLDTESERLEELQRRLIMYRLRSKVMIEPVDGEWAAVAIYHSDGEPLPANALTLDPLRTGAMVLAADPRRPALGWRLIGPIAEVRESVTAMSLPAAPFDLYDTLRVREGVPDGSRDLIVQKSTLLESNFDEIHGVAFNKGCFIGQELTARMHYRGLLKKRLVPVRLEGGTPPFPGAPVMVGDQEVGELRSTVGDLGLALLRLEHLGGTATPMTAGASRVVPLPPSWLRTASR